jgi:hypothetical protein
MINLRVSSGEPLCEWLASPTLPFQKRQDSTVNITVHLIDLILKSMGVWQGVAMDS